MTKNIPAAPAARLLSDAGGLLKFASTNPLMNQGAKRRWVRDRKICSNPQGKTHSASLRADSTG
ncbi:MAG: hypothetical protein K8R02_00435 [Anaerohalosphaeraceae bacterium]|nr:hypothetical protein [Anaerohalosphaeraceae bacterium]